MGTKLIDVDYDFGSVAKLVRALHNPVAADPGTPVNGEIWYNSTSHVFKIKTNAGVRTIATTDDVSAGGISASLFDAFTILAADVDNTPAPLTVGASTVVGRRSTGGIVSVSYADLKTDLEALNIAANTLGGSTLAQVLARSAHTGTQLASTISDFNTAADARVVAGITGKLDTATYDANSTVVAVTDNTPVVQAFVASTVLGRRASGNVTAITYANLLADLEALGITAADLEGSNLATVLARGNHTGTQTASTISDFDTAADARVSAGISALVDAAPGTLDTLNELAAALGDDANFATTTANALGLKTEIYTANFGNAALQSFTFSHTFATTNVLVQVFRNSDGALVECGVAITDANTVTVTTVSVPASNAYRVHIVGRNL